MNKASHLKDVSLISEHRVNVRTKSSGEIVSLNISKKKGEKKKPVSSLTLIKEKGVKSDAHFSSERQLSLLPLESVRRMKNAGLEVGPGSFAENITMVGIEPSLLKIGQRLKIGPVIVEVTHIGKDCHKPCAIYKEAGYCVMPTDGVFAKILSSGEVKNGDTIEAIKN
ncbi:MAG TPA: MOSC domain-containing protein [Actinobacteria bacterium]|nr:MOSC domain-containing protein [Actinomycetota bacterium]